MSLTESARAVFAADRFASLAGIAIEEVGEHECRCALALDECHRNARGVAMGGVLFTMADFAAAVAANSDCLGDGDLHWVSLDATIHYLAPATGATLHVRCSPLKKGRTTSLYQSIIESPDNGKCVAVVETTMMCV